MQRTRINRLAIATTICLVSLIGVGRYRVDAGWFEGVRSKTEELKEKWREREHPCRECDKTIHVGELCASCQAKKAVQSAEQSRQRLEEQTQQMRDKWQQSEHPCAGCGKPIHLGRICATCEAKRINVKTQDATRSGRDRFEQRARSCTDCGRTIHVGTYCYRCVGARADRELRPHLEKMRTNYRVYTETHTGEWKGQMAEYGDKFKELAATPGNKQEHAKVLAETLQNLRADTAIVGLKLIPMVDPETREIAPLDMVARKLTGRMNLEGSFGEDPVAAGYYTMVRKGFLFREARIVPMPNGSYVSIEQATRLPSSIRATATEFAEICRRIDSALEEGDPVAFASATIALSRSVSAFTTGDDQLAKKLGL